MKFKLLVNKQTHSTFERRNTTQAIQYAKLKSRLFGKDAIVTLLPETGTETIGTYWLGMEVRNEL